MQIPDADDECVHKLPWSIFASLEEHSTFQNTCQDYPRHSTKRKEKLNSQILAYIITTGTLQFSVCKEEYTNRTYFHFKQSSCNKFSTDLFWVAKLLDSEHFSKCSSTKIVFYNETFVKVTCNHFLSIIIQWIFL